MPGFRRNEQFMAVRHQGLSHDLAESFFRRSIRGAVIIGQVKMCDAPVESVMHHFNAVTEVIHFTEIMPQAQRNFRELDPAFAAAPELHGAIVSQKIGRINTIFHIFCINDLFLIN
jgi:hypothetical protein